jgi:transposase-like protein
MHFMTEAMTTGQASVEELPASAADAQLVAQLVVWVQAEGLRLTSEDRLLQQLAKQVLESAPEGEMEDHLGCAKGDAVGMNGTNSRDGSRLQAVSTEVGPVELAVLRDRQGNFEPQIARKRQKHLTGVDKMVIPLAAKGLTIGETKAHLAEVYGAGHSRQSLSTTTNKVVEGMAEWQNRPLDSFYPVIAIDATHVKVRDGKVANRPVYAALAFTAEGARDLLGLWAGRGGEDAEDWISHLTELRDRGVEDVLLVICDGLRGLPEAIEAVWRCCHVALAG